MEEKKAISDDIRDVYAEAKGNGFDVKALRSIVRLRKLDTDERREQEAVLETYMHALGMLTDHDVQGAVATRVETPAKAPAPAPVQGSSGEADPGESDDGLDIPPYLRRTGHDPPHKQPP